MMNKTKIWSFVGVLAGICTLAQADVPNPSFEDGSGRFATNWNQFGNTYREAVGARTGTYSMKMFGNFSGHANASGVYQDFAIRPGQSASSSVYALNMAGDAMSGDNFALLKLIYRDAANNDVVASESVFVNANTPHDQFQYLTANLGPAPAGIDHGSVFLLIVQAESTPFAGGAVFFDDVSLTVKQPVTSVTTTIGTRFAGNLASLSAVDNDRYSAFNDDSLTTEITMGVSFSTAQSALEFSATTSATRPALAWSLGFYNYNTASFDDFASDEEGLTDSEKSVMITSSLSSYIQGGASKAHLLWMPFNDETVSQDGWLTKINEAHFVGH